MRFEEVQPSLNDAALLSLNPLGKVPTLVADDQAVMFDSVVISDYLELVQPDPLMIPVDRWERIVVRRWEALSDGICDVLITAVLELRRPRDRQDEAVIDRADRKVRTALEHAAAELGNEPFAHGNSFTLADAALLTALGYVQLRRPRALDGLDVLRAYAKSHAERPSIAATVPPQ